MPDHISTADSGQIIASESIRAALQQAKASIASMITLIYKDVSPL